MYTQNVLSWSPQESHALPVQQWQFPKKDCYFFCDLHADADALLRSLQNSHLLTQDSCLTKPTLTSQGKHAQIIIGGDCFDKGPSNLKLLQLLGKLKQHKVDLVLLAGNHDIRVFSGLKSLDLRDNLKQQHFFTRMGRKTAALFAEIYQKYHHQLPETGLTDQEIATLLFPSKDWFEAFPQFAAAQMSEKKIQKELRQIQRKQEDFILACAEQGLNLQQVYQSVKKAQQLFIEPNGEFYWFFNELKLLHQSGSYLFCHAGLDDKIAGQLNREGEQQLNTRFQNTLQKGELFELYYNEMGNVFRTKYRDNDKPLTEAGAQQLLQTGIYALVNGHRSHVNGQQLYVRNGLLNFECDTELNANCRQKRQLNAPGYSATIFFASGLVSAICSELAQNKHFHPQNLQIA